MTLELIRATGRACLPVGRGSNPVFRSGNIKNEPRFNGVLFFARMVELVDTLDLKSNDQQRSCGFKSRSEYRNPLYLIDLEGFLFYI